MKSAHKVSIGSCDPGTVNGAFAYRLIQLAQARSARLGPFVRVKGSGLLSKQRNRVVKQFLDGTKSDWLLLIDSDEQLSLEAFDKLLETAHDKERPVVAGLVFAGFGIEANADTLGKVALGATGVALAAHAIATNVRKHKLIFNLEKEGKQSEHEQKS